MLRRLKVYFIHSTKMDYNNLLYRYILSSPVLLTHELMLPQSKNYQQKYVKDLMNAADLIVAEVSDPTFTLKLELKWVQKVSKPIKYISLSNSIPPKIKNLVPEIEHITDEKPMIKIIEDFVSHYANMTVEEQNDKTVILGEFEEKGEDTANE